MGTPLFKLSDPIGDCSNDNKTPTFYQYMRLFLGIPRLVCHTYELGTTTRQGQISCSAEPRYPKTEAICTLQTSKQANKQTRKQPH